MEKQRLEKYARLIAAVGANVRKGQEVFINAALDQPEFVAMVVEECYKLGAKRVFVDWTYQPLTKINCKRCSVKTLGELADFEEARWKHYVDNLPCRIYLESDDPDGMKGVNAAKVAKATRNRYRVIKGYRDRIENRYQWCIAGVPGIRWAKKLFPELSAEDAVEKLWNAILDTARVTDDPVQAWKDHNADLKARCAYLNAIGIDRLHYSASNGTDLTVGLMPRSRFCGGAETNLCGITFDPNIPSEECFTSPMKGRAEGIVYSTMPLSYNSHLIEDFSIRFENGKAVEWHARKNEKLLTEMLNMDENAGYLGECALVPFDSPINNTGILFLNTLYDENASCHLALGAGYADTIEGFEHMTLDECHAMGLNESMIHVDFMIGSADMNIDAITADGKTVPVFRGGNWAF